MAFIRKIKKSSGVYLAEVESYREDGKIKQRVLHYLGKDIEGKPSRKIYPDRISVKKVLQYMDVYVINELAKELKLFELLGEKGKYILALIYSHLLTKKGISKISDWIEQTDIREILGISEEQISTKQLFNAINSIGDLDFEKIQDSLTRQFEKYEKGIKRLIVLDVTDTYFNGGKEKYKKRRGKDGKYSRLIQIALAVSFKNGFPLFYKQYEGNINNVKIFQDMLSEIRGKQYKGIIIDRGMYSQENLDEIHKCQIEGIVGVRLHKNLMREYIDKIDREEIYSKECQLELKETTVYIKEFDYMQGKLIAIYNPELEVHKRDKHFMKGKPQEEAKYLGYSLIYQNAKLDSREAVKKYFEKDIVEKSFREMKGVLSLRPIRVWLKRHVEAHIKICYLSYNILTLLKYKLRGSKISPIDALEQLKHAYKVKLEETKSNFEWEKIVTLTKLQKTILKKLGVVYKI